MKVTSCPNCGICSPRSGFSQNGLQRYQCRPCNYRYTCNTQRRKFTKYYLAKALQLFLEGLTYKTIAEILDLDRNVVSKHLDPYKDLLEPIRLDRKGAKGELHRDNNAITFQTNEGHSSGLIIKGRSSEVWGVKRKV
jgi:transposase-like protein